MHTETKNHNHHASSKTKAHGCRQKGGDETAEHLRHMAHEAGREARHLLDSASEEMSGAGGSIAK